MRNIRSKNIPHIFLKLFGVPCHAYPINFSFITLRKKCPYSELFWSAFSRIRTSYSVRMWKNADQTNYEYRHFPRTVNLSVPRTLLKTTRFAISARGPILWNNCLSKTKKKLITFNCSNKWLKKK